MAWWIEWLVRIGAVLGILALGWVLGMWVRRLVTRALQRAKFDATLTKFFSEAARWAVIVAAVLIAMSIFGIEATSIAALIAAVGLAIGLAFQGTLSNFAAGVMLLAFRPFKVGDVVEIGGEVGTVDEIELFFTQIDTFDNRRLIVPNSQIFGDTIENLTHHPVRRAEFNVGTAYSADLDKAREVITNALDTVEGRVEDPPPQVLLWELGDSSVNWIVRVWAPTADLFPTRDRAIRAVKQALDEAGVTIPFPQRDVHVKNGSGKDVAHDAGKD